MDREQELIEATMYLLTESVKAVHSAFQSEAFKEMFTNFTFPQKAAAYSIYTLMDSTISFGQEVEPTFKNYNIMVDNTDNIQEFIINIIVNSETIPQFEFFRNFYNYYKKIQISLNS